MGKRGRRFPHFAGRGGPGTLAPPRKNQEDCRLPPHYYLWLKALHIAFMVTWFAGLFYLPRLFIYHAEAADEPGRRRFTVMEQRLFAITTIGAVLTAVFGLAMLWMNPSLLERGWLHLKLALVVGLIAFHVSCKVWIGRLERASQPQPSRGLRWFNEIPTVLLLAIVLLAVLKPG